MSQRMTINKARLMKRAMKATQTTMVWMRNCITLAHPETSKEEGGGEAVAVTVHDSAGEGMDHANTPRLNQERLNNEPLRFVVHRVLLHRGSSLPLPQDSPMNNSSKILV